MLFIKEYRLKLIGVLIGLISVPFICLAIISVAGNNVDGPHNKTETINTQRKLEELKSLPYMSWSREEADDISGVTIYNRLESCLGYNLYTDDATKAILMDMYGNIVHEWQFPDISGKWEYVELLEKGQIVALCVGKCFCKLDRDSNVIWRRTIRAHHDIEILSDGSYLVPILGPTRQYNSKRVNFETILDISEQGEVLDRWSNWDNLKILKMLHPPSAIDLEPGGFKVTLKSGKEHTTYDYYHLNTIEAIKNTPLAIKSKQFQQGNWLICLRNTNLILILDKESKDIVWHWGPGELDWPHMPTMLDNGNILVFDNGTHRSYSRVLEINPVSKEIVWEYKAEPPEKFHSMFRGNSQRLPNGNTLICEAEEGHVFEVTREKKIVWEFWNPEIKDGKRKLIYRMIRVVDRKKLSFIY